MIKSQMKKRDRDRKRIRQTDRQKENKTNRQTDRQNARKKVIRLFERFGDQKKQSQLPSSCQCKSRSQDEKIPDAHDTPKAREWRR